MFKGRLSIPVIGAPLFIISVPDLVIAQCKAGVVGSFPALNARPPALLDEWLARIKEELAAHDNAHPDRKSAPFAVNQIVHRSNNRLEQDLALCEKHKVPMIITSLGAREELNQAAHRWGGIVFHDVINQKFAHKAIEKGADGLILVSAGAGGHAGEISPFAFVAETRQWFDGPIALSGAIGNGRAIRAARMLGADFAYIGSAFIATPRPTRSRRYKQMVTTSGAEDIVYSNLFTGVHGNYLKPSIMAAGMDPDNLPQSDPSKMSFGTDAAGERAKPKAWKEIWGSGQGDRQHQQGCAGCRIDRALQEGIRRSRRSAAVTRPPPRREYEAVEAVNGCRVERQPLRRTAAFGDGRTRGSVIVANANVADHAFTIWVDHDASLDIAIGPVYRGSDVDAAAA